MSRSPSLLIAGCGDIGSRLALQMLARGWTVRGMRRDIGHLPTGVLPLAADLHGALCPPAWPTGELDYLVYCLAASEGSEAGYRAAYVDGLRHVLGWLAQHGQRPRRVLFVSSTSVYGQCAGEWLDETSATEPTGYSGRIMLEAEQLLLGSGLPASVVRLTGIYGPGRQWLLNQVRQGYRVVSEPPLYGNRIHADDAAGLLPVCWRFCCWRTVAGWRWIPAISASTTRRRPCMRWWPGCARRWRSAAGPPSRRCAAPAASAAAMPAPAPWAGCRSTPVTARAMGRCWRLRRLNRAAATAGSAASTWPSATPHWHSAATDRRHRG